MTPGIAARVLFGLLLCCGLLTLGFETIVGPGVGSDFTRLVCGDSGVCPGEETQGVVRQRYARTQLQMRGIPIGLAMAVRVFTAIGLIVSWRFT